MNKIKELTYADRCKIELMCKKKMTYADIARELDVNKSTICREIKKGVVEQKDTNENIHKVYLADYAETISKKRKSRRGKLSKLKIGCGFLVWATDKIKKNKYSPSTVVMEARRDNLFIEDDMVCAWTLYRYIEMQLLPDLSRDNLHYSKKLKGHQYKRGKKPPKYKTIEDRPKEILKRKEFGHWEMDTVVGLRGKTKESLLVLTERKYRIELIFLLKEHTMACVVEQLNKLERKIGVEFHKIFKTITVDNGVEFSDHYGMQKSIFGEGNRVEIYYCHPYCSGERGTNENTNKLIRYFLPKGYDFSGITEEKVLEIQNWINNYPRKLFNGASAKIKLAEELKDSNIESDKIRQIVNL